MSENLRKSLLENKVHFGHLSRKWNPKMKKYIFMTKDDIHILDLNKTIACLQSAAGYMKSLAKSGRKILFVGTKDQARDVMESTAAELKMPYASERWLGGTLTNFGVIKKMIKSWQSLEKSKSSHSYQYLTKKEKLMQERRKSKSASLLEGLKDITRLPAALFVVDINRERNAVLEAKALKIPVIAIVDTNSNPDVVDVPIPANDDAVSSIKVIVDYLKRAISEGLEERMKEVESKKEISVIEKEDESKKVDIKKMKQVVKGFKAAPVLEKSPKAFSVEKSPKAEAMNKKEEKFKIEKKDDADKKEIKREVKNKEVAVKETERKKVAKVIKADATMEKKVIKEKKTPSKK